MNKYIKSGIAFLVLSLLTLGSFFMFSGDRTETENDTKPTGAKVEKGIYFITEPGFYQEDLDVKIGAASPCTIYYTVDGEVPGETVDKESCRVYSEGGIRLSDDPVRTIVYSITARPMYPDGTWGDCIFNTFSVGRKVNERFTNLTVFITCDPDKLFGYENGILVAGKLRDDWIAANPNEEVINISPAGFNLRGWASERSVNIQMFTPQGEQVINQTVGVRPFGAYSRAAILKSLKVYARTDYEPVLNKLSYPFFGEQYALDGSGRLITEYKRVLLRSSGSDLNGSHMRDELHQTLADMAGFPGAQKIEPVSVFLNGEYYGSMWMHDVICDKWFEQHYGYYPGTMAVASGPERSKPDKRYEIDTIEEDQFFYDEWNNIYEIYGNADMTDDDVYAEFCKLVDVDNFLFYYAINTYINNYDWPYNNHKAYRYYAAEGEEYREGTVFDGRWRFLVHDMDWHWGASKNILNTNILNPDSPRISEWFIALMKREDCVAKFVDYCLELMNGAFSTENYIATVDAMHEERYTELKYYKSESKYSKRTLAAVESSVEENRIYAKERPATLIADLKQAFGISGNTYKVVIAKPENCTVVAGNWEINEDFEGTYVVEYGETYSCIPKVGYEFSHWVINGKEVTEKELYIDSENREAGMVKVECIVVPKKNIKLSILEYSCEGADDYIVIYNPSSTETLTTYGYSLSDTEKKLGKYMIPKRLLKPGESLVVYCNNYSGTEKYHQPEVPFNLKTGERLYLSKEETVVEDILLMELHDGYCARRSENDGKFYEKNK